jgi:protein-S-isoprenylcysteine O-methyltransferase Ste14
MYVDFYGFSLGLAIIFAADWVIAATAVLAIVMHYFVIRREERFLEAKFGDSYRAYCARVKRYGLF